MASKPKTKILFGKPENTIWYRRRFLGGRAEWEKSIEKSIEKCQFSIPLPCFLHLENSKFSISLPFPTLVRVLL